MSHYHTKPPSLHTLIFMAVLLVLILGHWLYYPLMGLWKVLA